jgi:hypothetical protein
VTRRSAEYWRAKQDYEWALQKVKEFTDEGRDPGGLARDLELYRERFKELGGKPKD